MTSNIDQSGCIYDAAGVSGEGLDCTDQSDGLCEVRRDRPKVNSRQFRPGNARDEGRRTRTRRRRVRARATISLAAMAREYIWLWDVRHGICINEIAMREGVTSRRVRQ